MSYPVTLYFSYAIPLQSPPEYPTPSLPLDRAGRLRGHVVDDAVDAFDFVDDARRDAAEQFVRKGIVIGGHAVGRSHGPERADMIVTARVAHHADGLDRQQHGKGLPDRVIKTGVADFLEIDRVGLAQDVEHFARDLARNADGEAGAREGMALHHVIRQAQLAAQFAHFVLE